MSSKPSLAYCLAAVALSLLWWLLLQLAPDMRRILGGPGVLEVGNAVQLMLFAVAGLATAVACRRWIVAARGARNLVLGVLLPFLAAEVFCVLLVLYQLSTGNSDVAHAVVLGPWMALLSFYVVVPLGILTQYAMRAVGRAAHARPAV